MSSRWLTMLQGCGASEITQHPRYFRIALKGSSWGPLVCTACGDMDRNGLAEHRSSQKVGDDEANEPDCHMPESRLPKKILRWEIINGCCAWVGEILQICQELSIPSPIGPFMPLYTYHIESLECRALVAARGDWREQAPTMPKLRMYIQVRLID